MELGVVLLDARAQYSLEILAFPIDLKMPCDSIHEALVALEHFKRASNPAHGEKGRVGSAEYGVGIGQSFPI